MKKELIIFFILLSFVVVLSGCGKNSPKENIPAATQKNVKNNPNALDYMAPGYKQAQDKIKQIKEIKEIQQHSIENNSNDFEN